MFNGNIGGPINKKTSFYVDGQRRDIEDTGIVNATVLDPNLNLTTLVEAVPTPTDADKLSAPESTPNSATTIR